MTTGAYATWTLALAKPLHKAERARSMRSNGLIFMARLKMKPTMKTISIMLCLGMPLAAHASCDRYQNDTFTLNMPATITVPDSLPIGSVITRQMFNGSVPEYYAQCILSKRQHFGRYAPYRDPATGAYPSEAPGVGVAVMMKWYGGGPASIDLHNVGPLMYTGQYPSNNWAEAVFYKIGPVTGGTVPTGSLYETRWFTSSNTFRLQLGNPVRFIRPSATCDLASGDVNRTIRLPTIQASALNNAVSAGALNFELTATCNNATAVTFSFTGTPATGNNVLFANTGSAAGIALWLYSRTGGTNQTISNNSSRVVAVSGNRAVLPLGAAYYRNGTVRQGTLASTATVNITYN